MKKFFKILAITLLSLIFILIAAALILPSVFKDDIAALIKKEASKNLNAELYFDADDFSMSLFRHFPSMTVQMENFGIIGVDQFKNDTLASIQSFEVGLDVLSLFGDKIEVDGVYLGKPNINVIVDEEGNANYDIVKATADTTVEETDTTQSALAITVSEWKITEGKVVYDDRQGKMFAEIINLNHSGSGDITLDVFDLKTETSVEKLTYKMDDVSYLSESKLDADMDLVIDNKNSKYTFKENTVKLNDLSLGFDGWVGLPEDADMDMDLTFAAKETEFKNILSLVPGVFLEGFEDLKTAGTLKLEGMAKGKMTEELIPKFNVNLLIKDGMFQYPDLPTAVTNINADIKALNTNGILDSTILDIKNFHMDMGKNPVDFKLWAQGLEEINLKADVDATVDLASLNEIYPIDDIETMRGLFSLNLMADGVYNDSLEKYPFVNASMNLRDGYVKSTQVPSAIENIQLASTMKIPQQISSTHIGIDNFSLTLDGETVNMKGTMDNLDNPRYDVSANGAVDIGKMMKIYPIEGMNIDGRIVIRDFNTKGNMELINNEQYDQLPTKGSLAINNFSYSDEDFPQGVKINTAECSFNPKNITLSTFDGSFGKSDMNMSGSINNYLGYLFSDKDSVLKGSLVFNSNNIDINEMMGEPTEETTETETSEELEVIPVPKDIDFVLTSDIKKVLYDDWVINNLKGKIIVRDGKAMMERVRFGLIGAEFVTNGVYDTENPEHPIFSWDMDIANLGLQESFKTFNTVQTLAPIAEKMEGKLNGLISISGELMPDMMPDFSTLNGKGVFKLLNAKINESETMNKLEKVTKFNGFDEITITEKTKIKFAIEDGKVAVDPIMFNLGSTKMEMFGTNSFDGTMDYTASVDLPAKYIGGLGQSVTKALNLNTTETYKVNIGIAGAYDNLKTKILGVENEDGSIKNQVKENIDEKKEEVKERVEKKVDQKREEIKKEVEEKVEEKKEEAKKEVKDKVKDEFKDLKKGW